MTISFYAVLFTIIIIIIIIIIITLFEQPHRLVFDSLGTSDIPYLLPSMKRKFKIPYYGNFYVFLMERLKIALKLRKHETKTKRKRPSQKLWIPDIQKKKHFFETANLKFSILYSCFYVFR